MSYRRTSIFAVIALLIAAACTQPPPSGGTSTPQATGGAASTLVWSADTSDLISLDPAVAYEFTGVLLAHNAYETLVKFEGADLSTIKPALAQSWDIKDSGSQWDVTFKLRSGAKFASGNAITADDVVYSFQRVLKLNKSPAFLFTDIAQIKDSSIKASDASTVVISLPKTASPQGFLAVLTFTIGSVVDSKDVKAKEAAGDSGSGYLLDHSSGSGAFDYDGIVKDLFKGGAKKVQDIVPAGLAGYNESTPFQADVNKAKALLQQAGQTAITLELLVPTGPAPGGVAWADLAAKLQSDWKNIGVTVNIKQTTQAELLGTYRAQKGQLVMILWGPDFPDPDANVGPFTDFAAN